MKSDANLKITRQRKMILDILKKSQYMLSAYEIFEKTQQEIPSIALSTIYRNIDVLKKINQIEEVFFTDDNLSRYHLVFKHHQHFMICTSCHQTIALEHCYLKNQHDDILKSHGFVVSSHKLEFYGLCKQCSS